MSKQKTTSIETAANEIVQELARWESIRRYGSGDPFWPDGTNMNLVRNHIISSKRELQELCQDGVYPKEYYLPTPPEVDNDWICKNSTGYKKKMEMLKQADFEPSTAPLKGLDIKAQELF